MKRYVVVFRSRTDVFTFVDDMKNKYFKVNIVQTPKQAKVGCGLSAEIPFNSLSTAKSLIKLKKYPSFYGIFLIGDN